MHVELRDSTGLYRYYGAEFCFDVAISPDVPVIDNEWICQYYANTSGTSLTILPGAAGLPVTTTYAAHVFSNETGCEFTQPFRAEDGQGDITIVTTCPEPETFSRVRLNLYDAGGEETLDLGGELCVDVDVAPRPPVRGRIGELCSTSVEATDSWVPVAGDTFPYDNAYAARETTNTSTCTAGAGTMRRSLDIEDEGLVLVLSMAVTCDETPATEIPGTETPPLDEYFSFGVRFDDVRGGDYTYPGQLCVKIIVTPPLHSDPTVGELCSDVAWAADTWMTMASGQFPLSGTYTAIVVANDTGSEAAIDPEVVVGGVEGTITGHFQVWINCSDPTETPGSTVTATSTESPGTTASTSTVISTTTPGTTITGLPTTGAGPFGGSTTVVLIGAGLAFLPGAWAVSRNLERR